MENNFEFAEFPKIPRLRRGMVVTEKVDGSNAQIYIRQFKDDENMEFTDLDVYSNIEKRITILAGSRTRWITPGKKTDNFGFAEWVKNNAEELVKLGPGKHFGEWFGSGIQRNYGLTDKRFALFNVNRWYDPNGVQIPGFQKALPAPTCCTVVPALYLGDFNSTKIDECIGFLMQFGSQMVPGFMKPEGIVVYHEASRQLYKQTIENDETPKSQVNI